MKFDISKSKLYTQIMEGLTSFFSLGEDATESDIHDAIDGQKPLKEQLEAAANTDARLQEITERLTTMEAKVTELEAQGTAKDERIAELQTSLTELEEQVSEKENAITALKSTHEKEIKVLAGQVSTLKAGKVLEQDEGGDPHAADKEGKSAGEDTVYVLQEGPLKKMIQARQSQN